MEGIKNFSKSNLLSKRIFNLEWSCCFVNEIYQLLVHVACMSERCVLKIRKTLELFYIKEADWNLSRFHICFYWAEVFITWENIFISSSPFLSVLQRPVLRWETFPQSQRSPAFAWRNSWTARWRGLSRRRWCRLQITFSNIFHILSSFIRAAAIW